MKRVLSEEGRKALSDNMTKQNKLRKIDLPEELLRKYYLEEDLSVNQIVEKYGITKTTLVRRLKEYNIKKPKELISKKKSEARSLKLDITKEKLENLYIKENLPIKELCLKLDISKSSLMRLLKRYNIRKPKELELNNRNKTMINKYGVINPFASNKIKEKIKQTNREKYGVDYACQLPQAIEANKPFKISKANIRFSELLKSNGIDNELEYKNFDIKLLNRDIVIEINPTYTHNSTKPAYFKEGIEKKPKDKDYHLSKTLKAKELGLQCIHVFDWDSEDKIVYLLKDKETVYARKCELREVSTLECNEFLNKYHLQNSCLNQEVRLGLYYNDSLIEIMTFGKPRYNKKYEYELLRLCSHPDYIVVGGASKIFKHFIKNYNPKSIISYCDISKFSGEVYTSLGFTLLGNPKPSKHWYNEEFDKHITDNFLRQRGFDQLFGTDFGKGISNEDLMHLAGFLEIYDCGIDTYIWKGDVLCN